MKLVIGKTHLVLTAATRKRDPTVVVAVVALAMFPVHVFALRAGIGWDDDLPLRLWPAWHLEDGDLCFAWCGLFVGATHRDGPLFELVRLTLARLGAPVSSWGLTQAMGGCRADRLFAVLRRLEARGEVEMGEGKAHPKTGRRRLLWRLVNTDDAAVAAKEAS